MAEAIDETAVEARPSDIMFVVFLSILDVALAIAFRAAIAAIAAAAWVVVDEPSVSAVLVSDDLVRDAHIPRARVIEVVAPLPRCASRAMGNVASGVSQGAVLSDAPDSLAAVLLVGDHDMLISRRLVSIAGQFPSLTVRQDSVLEQVALGRSTPAICDALIISPTSAKRELRLIRRQLGVSDRADLAATAIDLGFPPRRVNRDR